MPQPESDDLPARVFQGTRLEISRPAACPRRPSVDSAADPELYVPVGSSAGDVAAARRTQADPVWIVEVDRRRSWFLPGTVLIRGNQAHSQDPRLAAF